MSDSIEVSIVMPCLNEAESLQFCIDEVKAGIDAAGVRAEIIVADNGSTDGSQDIAQTSGVRLIHVENKGYGSALIAGIEAAQGTYVLMGDADGSYDFSKLTVFLERLRSGSELVMGCRLPKGGGSIEPGAMNWLHRWIGNPVLSGIGKLFFNAPIDDFHCGLRAFRRDSILGLDLRCTGMEFASEMVVKAVINRLHIEQVPATLRRDRRSKPPHLNTWRDGWRHLRFLLLFSPKWLFFIPGSFLFLLGSTGMVTLAFGPMTIGQVTFDTNTMLVCSAAVLIGSQILFAAVYTKAFAIQAGLLRPDWRFRKLLSGQLVEWGIGAGLLLLIFGVGYLVVGLLFWKHAGFGPLPYAESLRIMIPGVTASALGVQCMFSGFTLAVLGLPHK